MFGCSDITNEPKERTAAVWQVHCVCMFIYINSRKMNPQYLCRTYAVRTGLYLAVQFRLRFFARRYIEGRNVVWNET